MNYKRNIVSIFLLFVYSISFAHDIVPHNHEESHLLFAQHESDESHIHEHVATNEEIQNQIMHNDHADQSLFDFVVCLFDSYQHGVTTNTHFKLENSKSLEVQTHISTVAQVIEYYHFNKPEEQERNFQIEKHLVIKNEFLLHSLAHRGPPTIS